MKTIGIFWSGEMVKILESLSNSEKNWKRELSKMKI